MRILVLDYLSYKGHKNFNKIHIETLLKENHQLHLVGCKSHFDNINNNNVLKSYLPKILTPNKSHSPLYLRIVYIICLLWARLHYKPKNYDLIIIPTFDPMSIWVYRTNAKLVLISHDVHSLDNKIKYLAVKSLPSHYIIVGLSQEMSERLKFLYPSKKIVYIPHGLCPISYNLKKPSFLHNENREFVFCPINNKYDSKYVNYLLTHPKLQEHLKKTELLLVVKEKLILDNVENDYIIKVGNDLLKSEYDYLLEEALAVILPYEQDYKYRCSGILFECVVRNTPLVCSNISSMRIYSNQINIKYFDDVDSFIENIEYFRVNTLREVDKSIFDPYYYWLAVLGKFD